MDVLTAAYHLVADYPGGATALAPQLGKAAGSLSHEVNRNSPHAKLGLVDAVKLTVLSGDTRIVAAFAAEAGGLFIPGVPAGSSDTDTMEALGRLAKEFSDLVGLTTTAMADRRVTSNELDRLEREAGELVVAAQQVLALVRSRHEQGGA